MGQAIKPGVSGSATGEVKSLALSPGILCQKPAYHTGTGTISSQNGWYTAALFIFQIYTQQGALKLKSAPQ